MKKQEQLVKETVKIAEDMQNLTEDKIKAQFKTPEVEPETKLTKKQLAIQEGSMWIEPRRKLPSMGILNEKLRNIRDHDWEYVPGVWENKVSPGETIKFWFCKYAGDPDCLWEIPANRKVYVPRMIANHLAGELDKITGSQAMVYHNFRFIEKPPQYWSVDDFTHNFGVSDIALRGKFQPVGAFS